MRLISNINHSLITENQIPTTPMKQLDEIDVISDSIDVNLSKEVKVPKDVLDSFKIKDSLNQEIWPNGKLLPEIKSRLIKIAYDFMKDLEIPKVVKIKDIIFTGSLANYNWSKYSDIDLHIVLDFNQFDAEPKIIEDYFYAQKAIWNQDHEIEVFGYPVELYVQNSGSELVATAVYSIIRDKWLKKPKYESFNLDKKAIKSKAEEFIYQLKDIRQDYLDKHYEFVVKKTKSLRDKIKRMRNAGLERGGEFSLENLVFKVLRRTSFLDQLDSYKAKAYDSLMSVMENQKPSIDENEVLDKVTFKYEKYDEDTTNIYAIYNGDRIGYVSVMDVMNGYWMFDGDITEEEYSEIFPSDSFLAISHLKIIHQQLRGKGIAKKLVQLAIDIAKKHKFTEMYLNASPMDSNGLDMSDLVGFYESFGFEPFLRQGGNTLMVNHLSNQSLNENSASGECVILIKGQALDDNTKRLYVTLVKNPLHLDRVKTNNSKGQPARMVILKNQIYRLSIVDGKLKAQGVAWNSDQSMINKLGLSTKAVAINNNKTPLHWETMKYNDIAQAIRSVSGEILNMPDIRWIG